MTIKNILFRTSYIFDLAGGLVAVAGGWLLGQPSSGANIGAGLLIMGGTALMFVAVATCIVAWIFHFSRKQVASGTLSPEGT